MASSIYLATFYVNKFPAFTPPPLCLSWCGCNRAFGCLRGAEKRFEVPLPRKSWAAAARGLSLGWMDGVLTLLAALACLFEVWCGVGVTQIQFKMVKKKFVHFSPPAWSGRLPDRSVQFGVQGLSASVQFGQFSSVSSVHELFWPWHRLHLYTSALESHDITRGVSTVQCPAQSYDWLAATAGPTLPDTAAALGTNALPTARRQKSAEI